jgi:hypothetical protein
MKNTLLTFFAIILSVILVNTSHAQRDSMRGNMKEQLSKLMKERLVEKVGLSESTANLFMTALDENGKEVRKLMRERKELMDAIDLDPSAADVESKMDRTIEIDIQLAEMRKSFKKELRNFMSAQEIAKTMNFRKKFEKELRKEIKKRRKGMNDDGPGGPRFDGSDGPGGPPPFDGPEGPGGPPPFDR